mmetsp:Transcript_139015/g.443919  ORF Transcript_139015/g.443919 Transcript_139015/m.443919 type:complete len:230 (+) Transcript_139015:183-872(+)
MAMRGVVPGPNWQHDLEVADDVVGAYGGLVNNARFSDVTFTFDLGSPLFGHKTILAARCAHFEDLFFGSGAYMLSEGSVHVPDTMQEAFLALLHVLYAGKLPTSDPFVRVEMLRLLDCYGMVRAAADVSERILSACLKRKEEWAGLAESAHRAGQMALRDKLVDMIAESPYADDIVVQLASWDVLELVHTRAEINAANTEDPRMDRLVARIERHLAELGPAAKRPRTTL